MDTAAYLRRLGVDDAGPPSAAALAALHRAHVVRVPYETIEIQLGRPTTVDPHEAAERIVECNRGGYCYHLNGAFSLLLYALGYDVVCTAAVCSRTPSRSPSARPATTSR
jgi:arylamine N-acetyltransferase